MFNVIKYFIYDEALLKLIFSLTGDMGVGKSCLLHQFTEKKCKHNVDVLYCIVNGNNISTSRVCKFYWWMKSVRLLLEKFWRHLEYWESSNTCFGSSSLSLFYQEAILVHSTGMYTLSWRKLKLIATFSCESLLTSKGSNPWWWSLLTVILILFVTCSFGVLSFFVSDPNYDWWQWNCNCEGGF